MAHTAPGLIDCRIECTWKTHAHYSLLKRRAQRASSIPRVRSILPQNVSARLHTRFNFPPWDRSVPYESHLTANIVAHCERYS